MTTTTWILLMALVSLLTAPLIGSLDLDAYLTGGDDATLSRISQQVAWLCPPYKWSVCFLLGVLCGHLFNTYPAASFLPRWAAITLFVALPYLVAVVSMIVALRAPGGLPATGNQLTIGLVPVVLWLTLGAAAGATFLHQTGP